MHRPKVSWQRQPWVGCLAMSIKLADGLSPTQTDSTLSYQERRHQQEEEERVKRETDEEKWKLAQKQVSSGKEDYIQGSGGRDITEDMSRTIFHECGQDGRSVLGMVAVQVERDPRTGATVVRSVAPVSAPGAAAAAAAMATTVFDDGRMSVHAIGGGGVQPSAEELGRILSVIDGVGMTALLDDVTVTTAGREWSASDADGERPGEARAVVESVNASTRVVEIRGSQGGGRGGEAAAAVVEEGVAVTRGPVNPAVTVREAAGQPIVTEEGLDYETPVTLTFLGYADSDHQEGPEGVALGRDDHGGVLTVERVVIDAGDGDDDEEVLGPSALDPEPGTDNGGPAGPVGAPERDGAFQEIQLDGSVRRPQAQGVGADEVPCDPATPTGRKHMDGSSKPKACQCCSIM
ncbi:unnamed protein product [Lota lota]